MKSLSWLSLGAIGLTLFTVEGPAAHAARRLAPLDDPPIAWGVPGHFGGRARPHRLVTSSARVRRHAPAPEGDPPIGGARVASAAVTTLAPSLHDTGRIARTELRPAGQTLAALALEVEIPRERVVRPASMDVGAGRASALVEASAPILELHGDVGASSLRQCRIEVARRRQVRLDQVDVGAVRVRWTVRQGGDVRDAEIVGAAGTDASVAACVKRLVSTASFIPQPVEVAVERTYAL